MENEKEVITYLRVSKEDRTPVGMIMCKVVPGTKEARVGYCVLHHLDVGKFDKKLARKICEGRINCNRRKPVENIHPRISAELPNFMEKCKKVFTEEKIVL